MNWGRVAVVALIGSALAAGAGVWYTQNYAYYDEIDPATVALTVVVDGAPVALEATDIRAIDADSAPHRWRVCARLTAPLPEGAEPFSIAAPTYGPGWFDCFDADQIGHDLESGAALAYLAQTEVHPDVDRVLAVYPDGQVFGWHQINDKTPERGVMD
ncbi:MAG: histidine kinase [Paracoccus denitrificans]|uniref:Histidine kinase n=1 Tax=Paracoccus denitrificans TaxID=266 RepID=A0A533I7R9_PARDE|nr:MAG: histidine kinase [Paracoccus denitrificans]